MHVYVFDCLLLIHHELFCKLLLAFNIHSRQDRQASSQRSLVSFLTLRPTSLFVENIPFFAFHALETQLPEVSEKFRSCFECFRLSPAVSFHQVIDTIKEVLNFVPTLCVLKMTSQLFRGEVIGAFALSA